MTSDQSSRRRRRSVQALAGDRQGRHLELVTDGSVAELAELTARSLASVGVRPAPGHADDVPPSPGPAPVRLP